MFLYSGGRGGDFKKENVLLNKMQTPENDYFKVF